MGKIIMKKLLSLFLSLCFMAQAQADLVTYYPFQTSPSDIMRQPVQNYTVTSWSATAINAYATAYAGTTVNFNHNNWTPTFITVYPPAPTETIYPQTITFDSRSIPNVPIPQSMITIATNRWAAGDTDNQFCLYDMSTDIGYQFQGTHITGTSTVTVTTAGAYQIQDSVGWWDNVWPSISSTFGGPGIGSATGNEICDGPISLSEALSGPITHAMVFTWPQAYARGNTESPKFLYPATSSDGTGAHGVNNDVPEGALLVVNPYVQDSVLIGLYGFNEWDMNVIHGLQRYGAYLKDTDGTSGIAFQTMNDNKATTSYPMTAWPVAFVQNYMFFVKPPVPITALDNNQMHGFIN